VRTFKLHAATRLLLGSLAAAVVLAFPQLAGAQAPGSLAQLADPNSCIEATSNSSTECPSQGNGLNGSVGVAVSPDGKNVYVIGNNDSAIAEFGRNPDGSLTQLGSSNDCIADQSADNGCSDTATGLVAPQAIAVSPDGADVYVAAHDSAGVGTVAEFARNADGSLTQLLSHDCIAENFGQAGEVTSACADQVGHGIKRPFALTVGPGGLNVYVTDSTGSTIAVLARASDGSLSQPGGADDCIADPSANGTDCSSTGTGLANADAVVVSPDGNNVYVGGDNAPGTIAEFTRNSDGSLTQLPGPNDCIQENAGALACGTETGRGINAVVGLAVSPDGHNVYATSAGPNGDLAEFARATDGSLTQLASPNDCIEEQGSAEGCGTTDGHGLNGASQLVVSADDASVYVATQGDDCCDQAVAAFSRASDGTVTQLPAPDECIDENTEDCSDDTGLGLGGGAVAIPTDGANVYTTGFADIAELARTPVQHTLSVATTGSGSGAVSDGTGAIACPPTCSHAYTANTEVTLTPAASPGSSFSGWSGACTGTGACQVTMSADEAVTATFTASAVAPTTGAPTPVLTSAPSAVTDAGAGFSGSVNPDGLPTNAHFEYGLDQRYSQVGASGPAYTDQTPAQPVGSDFSIHAVGPASVSGLVPNALYHVRLVATNSAGTTFGQDVTFTTARSAAPSAPTLGTTFNIAPVSGLVLVLVHGHLVPLTELQQVGPNVVLDTQHGTLQLTSTTAGGGAQTSAAGHKNAKTQTGTFGGAVFKVHQTKGGANKGLTTVMMVEGAFKGAPSQATCGAAATGAQAAKVSKKVIQLLHATGHGRFGSSGRYAAATVRGTSWTMTALCGATLTHDITDSVVVSDFVRHKKVILHPGQSYLAPGPRKHG
jgi:DNA-binding beta-propeller fold protein YncE